MITNKACKIAMLPLPPNWQSSENDDEPPIANEPLLDPSELVSRGLEDQQASV